jgi:hypothetical protein
MRPYTFAKKPKYCSSYRPATITVRCLKCGRPHQEYFGPQDHDALRAELAMLHEALDRASAIIHKLGGRAVARLTGRDKRRARP